MALALTANVECDSGEGGCGAVFEGTWAVAGADTAEDLDEVPVDEFICPGCGRRFEAEWPGWMYNTEAG
jgi:hypothetical protein